MSPHILNSEPKQRIPLELRGVDILLLLRLKHMMESVEGKAIKTNDVIRIAIRELAKQHDIIAD